LTRLLRYDEFVRSARLAAFVTFVVEETLAGRHEGLKGYTIGTTALGRDPTFDPQIDPTVRVTALRLRRTLGDYYRTEGADDPVQIQLPKGTYVPAFVARSVTPRNDPLPAPPVLREVEVQPDPWDESVPVLVVPIRCLDQPPSSTATWLTENIMNEVAKHDRVSPILTPEPSASDERTREIAMMLGVRYVLAGFARTTPTGGRVGVSITDVRTGIRLWGDDLRCDPSDESGPESVQEVARTIGSRVGDVYGVVKTSVFGDARHKPVGSLSVLEVTVLFTEYKFRQYPDPSLSFEHLFRSVEHALRRRPNDYILTAILAVLCLDEHMFMLRRDQPDMLVRGTNLAHRAVALDPDGMQSRLASAYAHLANRRAREAILASERVVELAPMSGYFVGNAGWFIALAGEWERGITIMERGMRLVPRYPRWFHSAKCLFAYRQGDYETALTESMQFETSAMAWSPLLRAAVLAQLGRTEAAREALAATIDAAPVIATDSETYLSRFIVHDDLVDQLLDGLGKAGLRF